MTIPRFSIGAAMTAVVMAAFDFMVVRSIANRPDAMFADLNFLLPNLLPMGALLAFGVASLIRGGSLKARPFLVGCVLGGAVALGATAFALTQDSVLEG